MGGAGYQRLGYHADKTFSGEPCIHWPLHIPLCSLLKFWSLIYLESACTVSFDFEDPDSWHVSPMTLSLLLTVNSKEAFWEISIRLLAKFLDLQCTRHLCHLPRGKTCSRRTPGYEAMHITLLLFRFWLFEILNILATVQIIPSWDPVN